MTKRSKLGLAAVAVASVLVASPVFALTVDTETYSLDFSNISPQPAPYGEVKVELQDDGTAIITFTADPDYLFLDSQIAGVNINATDWTITDATAGLQDTGSQNVDGFGTFNQTFKYPDGFGSGITTFSFTVTGGTWTDADQVLTPNNSDSYVVAHVAPISLGGDCTGYASDVGPSTSGGGNCGAVPEPGTVAWLGTALVGLGFLGKMRGRRL